MRTFEKFIHPLMVCLWIWVHKWPLFLLFAPKEEPYEPGFFLFNFNVILAIIHKEYLAKFGYRTIFSQKKTLTNIEIIKFWVKKKKK